MKSIRDILQNKGHPNQQAQSSQLLRTGHFFLWMLFSHSNYNAHTVCTVITILEKKKMYISKLKLLRNYENWNNECIYSQISVQKIDISLIIVFSLKNLSNISWALKWRPKWPALGPSAPPCFPVWRTCSGSCGPSSGWVWWSCSLFHWPFFALFGHFSGRALF